MQALREQSQCLAQDGAAFRRGLTASPAIYATRRLCVAFSAVRFRREIEAGGFELQPDFIGRVDVAAYPWFLPTAAAAKAALGQPITIDGLTYKIVEVAPIRLGGEILIGLGKH